MYKSLNKAIGNYGENLAEEYIKAMGYIVLNRNFRCKIGEIDLIAKDGDFIVFIEVKSRYGNLYGSPCESITYYKKVKIFNTAQVYILKNKLNKYKFRFDVIEVFLNKENNSTNINLIKDAFQI